MASEAATGRRHDLSPSPHSPHARASYARAQDRCLHHLPPPPAQRFTLKAKIETDLTESY
ncbi:hypothetical protein [Streptomyces sp. NPDC096132]|uniref:hypothetical protein n=1 Tax=Streptomyces sp. NPDC096132 TaxID=3366075 RepID=UPI00380375E4